MKTQFTEAQRYNQWWLWLLLWGIALIPMAGIVWQVLVEKPFGSQPIFTTGLIIWAIFMVLFIAFFAFMQLKTRIDTQGIQVQFVPFVKKNIAWSEVKNVQVVNYGFVGGWGIRIGTRYGTVYNIKGNKGLAIVLTNGQKFLIGTQKEEELRQVVNQLFKPS